MPKRDLRSRREALGLSRSQLARRADASAESIELYELGYSPRRSRVLPQILEALSRAEREGLGTAPAGDVRMHAGAR